MKYLELFSDLNINPVPLDFSNELTTTKWLLEIETKINEIIKEYNDIRENIQIDVSKEFENQVNELLKSIQNLKDRIGSVNLDLQQNKKDVENRIESIDSELKLEIDAKSQKNQLHTDAEVNKLNIKIRNFNDFLRAYGVAIEDLYRTRLLKMQSDIEEKISTRNADSLIVYNLWKGRNTSLSQAMKDIFESTRFTKLTWREINQSLMTWDELQKKNLTWMELENNGRFLLFDELYVGKIKKEQEKISKECEELLEKCRTEYLMGFSPFDGKRKNVFEIINELCYLHKNAITASELDALQISAQEFDELMLTAYQVDWKGKEMIVKD